MKKKGQAGSCTFRNKKTNYDDPEEREMEENTFRSLSKVLKSSNKTQKLEINCRV